MNIKKCIMPIAGRGTRFLPATKSISKEMLPIVEKPTIMLQVLEAYRSGIDEIIFVVGEHNEKLIKDFFSVNEELNLFLGSKISYLDEIYEIINNVTFHYVRQDESFRGTGGAIYAARDYIKDGEFFGVMFGDDLIDAEIPVLKQLIDECYRYKCNIVGVGEVPMSLTCNYGVVKYKSNNIVKSLVEKPKVEDAPSNHVVQGRYVISSEVFDKLPSVPTLGHNEYGITDGVMATSLDLRACLFDGDYYDIGSHLGYVKANVAFGMKSDMVKEGLKEFIKNIGE